MTACIRSKRLSVLGTGVSLPGPSVSSAELLQKIKHHFGISSNKGKALSRLLAIEYRHISRELEKQVESPRAGARNPDIATIALKNAIDAAKIHSKDLQYLIGHTASPAQLMPPNIAEVADTLNFIGPTAELRQACTGFANALQLVASLLQTGNNAPIAIVGSEVGSVFFDPLSLKSNPSQWVNLMQMGDGAGAIVLNAYDSSNTVNQPYLTDMYYGKLPGNRKPGFYMEGGSDYPSLSEHQQCLSFSHDYEAVKSNGGELFKAGVECMLSVGYTLDDFRFIIPHQVNGQIGYLLAREMGLPVNRFFVNANVVGNLGSAAIWVALHQLRISGKLNPGDQVLVLGAEATHYMYGGFVYVHA
jgi:3-oxoacyl-[acyl-carrier-protein] synthase III